MGVFVGIGVGVSVGMGVWVAVGIGVYVAVGSGTGVGLGVRARTSIVPVIPAWILAWRLGWGVSVAMGRDFSTAPWTVAPMSTVGSGG